MFRRMMNDLLNRHRTRTAVAELQRLGDQRLNDIGVSWVDLESIDLREMGQRTK